MARTRHFKQRMSERAITDDMVDLVRQYGEPNQDKIVLGRKALDRLLVAMRQLECIAKKTRDKGGLVVVEAGGSLITTYRLDSYDHRKVRSFKGCPA